MWVVACGGPALAPPQLADVVPASAARAVVTLPADLHEHGAAQLGGLAYLPALDPRAFYAAEAPAEARNEADAEGPGLSGAFAGAAAEAQNEASAEEPGAAADLGGALAEVLAEVGVHAAELGDAAGEFWLEPSRAEACGASPRRRALHATAYAASIHRNPLAVRDLAELRRLYANARTKGQALTLVGFGEAADVAHLPALAAILADSLAADVAGALRTGGRLLSSFRSGVPPKRAVLPPDFAPLREAERVHLCPGAVIHQREGFLGCLAARLFAAFDLGGGAEIPWERRRVVMYGKSRRQGRDTAFFGDAGTVYRYSGTVNRPLAWAADPSGALLEVLRLAQAVSGEPYNFCLLNRYADGRDSISPHRDDTRDLVPGSSIFSVSLGATRTFVLEPRAGGGGVALLMPHGSAIVMGGATQALCKHSVPPSRASGPRINLTFRRVAVARPPRDQAGGPEEVS